ncbi:MAG TPA: ABC transporter permease [Opitutaceae bacterium]|jgi:ABC-2 type transport system permease protein|nr:ABC transporter permease [Opitutaceae bacterium]
MNSIIVLLRKDFSILLKDRASIIITFLVPFALIYLFGQIYHVNSSDPGPAGIPVAVVNQSDNPAAAHLVDALKEESAFKVLTTYVNDDKSTRPLTEEDLQPMMAKDDFRFALVIPKDLIRTDHIGLHLKTYTNPRNEIESQTFNGILQKTIFSRVPQLIGESLQARARSFLGDSRLDEFNSNIAHAVATTWGGDEATIKKHMSEGQFRIANRNLDADNKPAGGTEKSVDALSQIVKIENTQVAGVGLKSPMATLLVGGWAMQFLLFALTASATALFREKEYGLFQRVLAAPVSRGDILWSKFLYGICLGLIQLVVLFFAGHVLYGIEIGAQLPLLVLVCIFAAAACTSFGMLIAAISPTPESARGMSTFVILLMCAIGGAWFPVSFMPEFIQRFSKLTLVYWSMEGFSQVLWSHQTLVQILPTLGYLTLITAIVMSISVWRFRKGRLFD